MGLLPSARTSEIGLDFRHELRIPALLEPDEEDGRKVFELTLQRGSAELLTGRPAETWGVNGAYLGPTLQASRGDEVELRVRSMGRISRSPGALWSPSWEPHPPARGPGHDGPVRRRRARRAARCASEPRALTGPDDERVRIVRLGPGDEPIVLAGAALFDHLPTLAWSERFLGSAGHHLLVALVEALAELARERDCYGMWVGTETDNEAALAAYRAAGAGPPELGVTLTWTFDR